MAIWVVGDVQGCYEALSRLLEKVNFDPAKDQLWLTGDLVNRGGQSLETLRLICSLKPAVTSVLGNHDLRLLAEDCWHPDGGSKNSEFEAILNAHDRESLLAWLTQCPLLYQHKPSNHLLVHAGLLPQWKLKEALWAADEIEAMLRSEHRAKYFKKIYSNKPLNLSKALGLWRRLRVATDVFTRMRFCDARGRIDSKSSGPPGTQRKGYHPWFELPTKRKKKWTVLFGHWAALGLHQSKRVICLDTGYVWGGKLTAMRLQDRKIVQVGQADR